MTLLIPAFANCMSSVTVNGSAAVPACAKSTDSGDEPFTLFNLPLGTHDITYDSGPVSAGQHVVFWGVDGTRPPDPTPMTNITVDDTHASSSGPVTLSWQGAWDHLNPKTGSSLGEQETLDSDFNKTVSVTSKTGASVTSSGPGEPFHLLGEW